MENIQEHASCWYNYYYSDKGEISFQVGESYKDNIVSINSQDGDIIAWFHKW